MLPSQGFAVCEGLEREIAVTTVCIASLRSLIELKPVSEFCHLKGPSQFVSSFMCSKDRLSQEISFVLKQLDIIGEVGWRLLMFVPSSVQMGTATRTARG